MRWLLVGSARIGGFAAGGQTGVDGAGRFPLAQATAAGRSEQGSLRLVVVEAVGADELAEVVSRGVEGVVALSVSGAGEAAHSLLTADVTYREPFTPRGPLVARVVSPGRASTHDPKPGCRVGKPPAWRGVTSQR